MHLEKRLDPLAHTTHWIRVIAGAILGLALVGSCHANLVLNGGFETGNLTNWTSSLGSAAVLNQSVTSVISHSGTYSAALGNQGGLGVLSQTVSGLSVGASYELSFWLRSDGLTPNRFAVSFGGDTLDNDSNLGAFAFTEFTYNFVATATSGLLQFGSRNDPGFLELDDVAVNALAATVPEPATLALVGVAFAFVGASRRRQVT